jgi:hypothetical protein
MRPARRAVKSIALALASGIFVAAGAGTLAQSALGYTLGSYSVELCTAAVGYENHSFVFTTNNSTYIESHSACGEPPTSGDPPTLANLALGDTLGPHGVPVGAAGAWTVKAPEGASISEVSGSDFLMKVGGNMGWNVYLESENTEGRTTVAQTCATSAEENECAVSGPFEMAGFDAKTVTIGAECDAEEYAPGHTYTTCARGNEFGHAVRAGLNFATITITDPAGPSSVTATDIPTEPQHGTITISASATDATAGLLSLSIIDSSDAIISGPVTVPGGCNYSFLTPCPTSANNLALPLNTEALPNGPQQIQIVATNAAHEQTISPPYTLDIANHPANPPSGGGEQTPQPNGSTGDHASPTTSVETPSTGSNTRGNGDLAHLQIRLAKPKLRRGKLLLTGTASPSAEGALMFTLRATVHGHRWTARAHTTLSHGRFNCTIGLPAKLHTDSVKLEILYHGSASYEATHRSWTIQL